MTLEILTHDLLGPIRHGFFTRRGGASSGVYAGLNCGPGSSDQSEAVSVNRSRVAEAMMVAPSRLLSLHQVHSADVVVATEAGWTARPCADAAVTATPGIALSVLTADCAPVLFSDPEAEIIGVAHAGWRGALGGVIEATLQAMEDLGARREDISAAIGPTISQRCYEVEEEFLERFVEADPDHARFFVNGAGERYLFDLPGFVLSKLRAGGVGEAGWIGSCTYAEPDRFFSYRRTTHSGEPDYGRLISAISLGH